MPRQARDRRMLDTLAYLETLAVAEPSASGTAGTGSAGSGRERELAATLRVLRACVGGHLDPGDRGPFFRAFVARFAAGRPGQARALAGLRRKWAPVLAAPHRHKDTAAHQRDLAAYLAALDKVAPAPCSPGGTHPSATARADPFDLVRERLLAQAVGRGAAGDMAPGRARAPGPGHDEPAAGPATGSGHSARHAHLCQVARLTAFATGQPLPSHIPASGSGYASNQLDAALQGPFGRDLADLLQEPAASRARPPGARPPAHAPSHHPGSSDPAAPDDLEPEMSASDEELGAAHHTTESERARARQLARQYAPAGPGAPARDPTTPRLAVPARSGPAPRPLPPHAHRSAPTAPGRRHTTGPATGKVQQRKTPGVCPPKGLPGAPARRAAGGPRPRRAPPPPVSRRASRA